MQAIMQETKKIECSTRFKTVHTCYTL